MSRALACAENLAGAPVPEHRRAMRLGNIQRRTVAENPGCAVCGAAEVRTLSTTTHADGVCVTGCGSRKVAHRRAEQMARAVDELRLLLCDRRVANG